MDITDTRFRFTPMAAALLATPVLLFGVIIGWFASTATTETIVRDYILENPEVLPQAMENLQRREAAKLLVGIRGDLERPFPGAILGNPQGKITLVEFTDFGCGYCRQSVADVEALVRENPDLKVVVREFPILSPQSADASRMGLAAAAQGKYAAFHHAMFAAGRPDTATIAAAAKAAGVDAAKARAAMTNPGIELELNRNVDLARQLGFNGTPSWVIGDDVLSGAVGKQRLAEAIAKVRG